MCVCKTRVHCYVCTNFIYGLCYATYSNIYFSWLLFSTCWPKSAQLCNIRIRPPKVWCSFARRRKARHWNTFDLSLQGRVSPFLRSRISDIPHLLLVPFQSSFSCVVQCDGGHCNIPAWHSANRVVRMHKEHKFMYAREHRDIVTFI